MIYYVPPQKAPSRQSDGCSQRDIPTPTDWAKPIERYLTSRYPKEGFIYNTDCEMFVYVIEGCAHYEESDGEHVTLEAGASVTIKTNVSYAWTAKESVRLLEVRNPTARR